jgi:hypothetical protein
MVGLRTFVEPVNTRLTVETDTPAASAKSLMVGLATMVLRNNHFVSFFALQ